MMQAGSAGIRAGALIPPRNRRQGCRPNNSWKRKSIIRPGTDQPVERGLERVPTHAASRLAGRRPAMTGRSL